MKKNCARAIVLCLGFMVALPVCLLVILVGLPTVGILWVYQAMRDEVRYFDLKEFKRKTVEDADITLNNLLYFYQKLTKKIRGKKE